MKIGIIGLGSKGRRHVACLQSLGINDIVALRTNKGQLKAAVSGVKEVDNWDEFLALNLEAAIIANPSSMHAETIANIETRGIRTLVEKPIHSSSDFEVSDAFKAQIRVAYCLRFHPLYVFMGELLDKNPNAKLSLSFERGYALPKWHPYADYRKEYSAQKALGGGVVRTLSHEIDLFIHWFHEASLISSKVWKASDLEIDVEDHAEFALESQKARAEFHLDFVNPEYTNKGKLSLDEQTYSFDFVKQNLIEDSTQKKLFEFSKEDLDMMYVEQMKDFLGFVKTGKSINCSFEEAMQSIKLIEQIAPH